ncbi:DNA polymerase III subunit epsilon [Rhodococcus qingshengii]|uniref:DNA polymerase III subunit epsilon n=2 Tax=Rhodococcus qingshengii TaxID=334542 RepID=A0A2A5J1L8_RHOSG|nr:DNA polymerase III subunit epsilon [Rhodococcus qingshengii]
MLAHGAACILDTETADLDSAVIEVSVIDAATGAVLLDTLVDPGDIEIAPAAHAVHGLTAADLVDAPRWPMVLDALLAVTAGRTILAYNADFDRARILDDSRRQGLNPEHLADPGRWGCIMKRRSQAEGTERHTRLGAAHRARGDAEAARIVLQGLAEGRSAVAAVAVSPPGRRNSDLDLG